uniref:Small ribosomal subunit protein uS3c n=3 Tax=Amphilophium TaxID=353918 RepID=A0A3S7UML9_9LAMI|nr:ribosomal protein S3 [Amphilophium dolichoides]YP_009662686.1 ribosomal protein S3 [Amphilophium dolichoides]YP_009662754.1 ribosomal protein S3 [Amphilophium carolinae]YP_009662783.1 ribosomal protein S3 [Amphilophium carolinae]AYH51559.1 ribosomal protein S3 [Amphilophium crucigerum]AYH51556.1 ribosomal protein S3 [Amphilophium carolinae]AYH51562.1 ribosomal protein S3 [Amphilophium dolichoides]QCU48179.1 ribosomal protein S3 [Amphilophium dolichoides]QCU48208.1 ribosomal protein S3 [A
MGQKINPLGFRLGTTQRPHSLWFAQPKNYPEGLQEDQKIRDFIKTYVQKNMKISPVNEEILRIEIQKRIDLIKVIIFTGLPKSLKGKKSREIKELQMNLQKEFHYVNLKISIKKIAKPYANPNILAEFIASQFKNRISFRKAIKRAIELTKEADTKGIQVQISGRIGGNEMARVEWTRKGRVPLQTVRAKIDYCSYTIKTIYGVFGMKIWIFIDKGKE